MRVIWLVLSVLIIVSMLLLFGPISPYSNHSQPVQPTGSQVQIETPDGHDADDLAPTLQ